MTPPAAPLSPEAQTLTDLCTRNGIAPDALLPVGDAGISAEKMLARLEQALGPEFHTIPAKESVFRDLWAASNGTAQGMMEAASEHAAHRLLNAAGLDAEGFLNTLNAGKKPVSAVRLVDTIERVFGAQAFQTPVAALSLRAMHLESGHASKTFNALHQMSVLKDPAAKPLQKLGAGWGAFRAGRGLSKEYLGIGLRKLGGNALGFFLNPDAQASTSKFRWPSFGMPQEDAGERALKVVEQVLKGMQKPRAGHTPIGNLAALVDITEGSMQGILDAAGNVLKDPDMRARLSAHIDAQLANDAAKTVADARVQALGTLSSREVQVALNEVLGAVGKFHNPQDVQRISDVIAISLAHNHAKGKISTLESMAKFWQAGVAQAEEVAGELAEGAQTVAKEMKIAFANKPSVNVGVAIASLAGAVYVGNQFAKPHTEQTETVDANGVRTITIEEHRAPFWQRAARSAAVVGLLSACGVAVFRAAGLPNAQGVSFVERALQGGGGGGLHVG